MPAKTIAPYGSWRSPISSALVAAGGVGIGQIVLDGPDVYWSEARPLEGGRVTVVRCAPDGTTRDLLPPPFNARTRVHEYGGGAYTVADGVVLFANFADQRLYRLDPSTAAAPVALTPACDSALRYADFAADPGRRRVICVREDHRGNAVANTIAAVAVDGDDGGRVLTGGNDFYAAPRLDPTGTRLAWLTWNHPNMPWDGCEVWVADVNAAGELARERRVAGGQDEALFQPTWSPDGVLHVVSDRTGWWNLYRWNEQSGALVALAPRAAEFGVPQWTFGAATYGFAGAGRIVCAFRESGFWNLATLEGRPARLAIVATPYAEIRGLRADSDQVVFVGGSAQSPEAVVRHVFASGAWSELRRSREVTVDRAYLSAPEPITFPTEGGLSAHAFYYPPVNADFTGPADRRPPLIVQSHGGPTSAADTVLSFGIQYWTSRGFGVLDVDYGGSTGYGRDYRRRLNGAWGVVDLDDCINAARYLVERGDVDADRLIIKGWSASGYTTLAALAFRDVFRAGESHFGISDLETMVRDTHKFESHYLDRLIGPYPARKDLYVARSPIHFTDRLSCPLLLFQGLEDKVVPPDQAERMFAAVRAKGIPVAYIAFPGEQHGFRRAEHIRRALDGALYFHARIFSFELPDDIEPIAIANI